MAQDYDKVREQITGMPGFQRSQSTIKSSGFAFAPTETYVIETVRVLEAGPKHNKSQFWCFLERVSAEGGQRIVLPPNVMDTIFRHRESIVSRALKTRGQIAAESRKAKAVAEAQRILDNED